MSNVIINSKRFYKRLARIQKVLLENNPSLESSDVIMLMRGKNDDSTPEYEQKSVSMLYEYILGYDFTDSLILFTPKRVIFYVSPKKKLILERIEPAPDSTYPKIDIRQRNTAGENEAVLKQILEDVKSDCGKDELIFGTIPKESGIGNLVNEFNDFKQKEGTRISVKELPFLVYEIIKIKDGEEINNLKTASLFACFVMKYINQKFEGIINDEKQISHKEFIENILNRIERPDFKKKFYGINKLKEEAEELEVSKLNIQSGGNYTVNEYPENDDKILSSDVIICKTMVYNHGYHGKLTRTYMIDADKAQQKYYKTLLDAFKLLVDLIQPGKKLSEVYNKVKEFIVNSDSSLENKIPSSFGYGTGTVSLVEKQSICESNETIIEEGMAFVLDLSIINLNNSKINYCLEIADTIIVPTGSSEKKVLTDSVSKNLTDIYYNLEDDEEGEDNSEKNGNNAAAERKNEDKELREIIMNSDRRVTRASTSNKLNKRQLNVAERKEHQLQLLELKNEEFRQKIKNNSPDLKMQVEEEKMNLSKIKSYDKKSQIPEEVFKNKFGQIYIDKKNYTIFLPINKTMVPFHISLIKNVSKSEDNRLAVLRINFLIPVSGITFGPYNTNKPVFIRDISYKHKDPKVVTDIITVIKDLSKAYKTKQQEWKAKEEIFKQEPLVFNKGKRIFLNNVSIKPPLSAKKSLGILEGHQNGFRFTSNKSEKQEIIYSNIKHAFISLNDNDITKIHFNLKKPIFVGKKKTMDIQFVKDIGVAADDLDTRKRGNEYEEYEMELRERQMKQKINDEFLRFTKGIEELKVLEFDIPFKNLQFTGAPFRSNVTLYPTKYCLISLEEANPFVLTLDEINVACFERVAGNLKNFDLTLIFKDLSKPPQSITAIPMEYLDMIKSWLDENNILFGEAKYNFLWRKIFQQIKEDPEGFLEEGGWAFFLDENPYAKKKDGDEEEEEADEEPGDSEYKESSEEEDDDDDDYDEEEEEESGDDYDAEEDLSEKGLSWDELENVAKKKDLEDDKRHREEKDPKKGKKKNK